MKKFILLAVILVLTFGWFGVSYADCLPPNVSFVNCFRTVIDPTQGALTASSFIGIAERIAGFLIVIGGIIAGIVIIVSGIMYMGAGSDTGKVTAAKSVFKNGIIGAIIFFAVGLIINTIALVSYRPFDFFF